MISKVENIKIHQYSTSVVLDEGKLSIMQKQIRRIAHPDLKKKTKVCRKCCKRQNIDEFYFKCKETGRRANKCRDCQMRDGGHVNEIGKTRFAVKIGEKGFRKCSICKTIKPLTDFTKYEKKYLGFSNNCKECDKKNHAVYLEKQKKELGRHYIEQWALKNGYNRNDFSDELIDKIREIIIEKRKPHYFIDKKGFVTIRAIASYLLHKYSIPITTTQKRANLGYTGDEFKLSETEARKVKNGRWKGKIEIVDLTTGEKMIFFNTNDPVLRLKFGHSAITEALRRGNEIYKPRTNSKYKNKCLIKRLPISISI